MKKIVNQYETDWLASRPIFYNTETAKVSCNINQVIDFDNIEFHPEGFNNYLNFGYSVFEQTPIKNVKFMRHSSKLSVYDDNSLEVEYFQDPVEKWLGKTTNENEVLDLIHEKISIWEKTVSGDIVLPLSGGFDSRLLVSMISDVSRLKCFTYGISPNQGESFEVVHAKEIAERLNLYWRQIELGDFHNYFEEWNNLFGVSTHAHGMYHIEFYKIMLRKYNGSMNFLSGIVGDAWAGDIRTKKIQNIDDLYKLGYTHGMSASSDYSLLSHERTILGTFFNENKDKLQSDFYQIITTIRMKIILISYLVSVPESFGFSVFAPFLDMDVALSMLCLPEKRRKNRQWQRDYFEKNKLDIDNKKIKKSFVNTLNYSAAIRVKLIPLQKKFYTAYIHEKYIDDINNIYYDCYYFSEKLFDEFMDVIHNNFLSRYLRLPGILYRIRNLFFKLINKKGYRELFLTKYCAYLTLKPFEYLFGNKK